MAFSQWFLFSFCKNNSKSWGWHNQNSRHRRSHEYFLFDIKIAFLRNSKFWWGKCSTNSYKIFKYTPFSKLSYWQILPIFGFHWFCVAYFKLFLTNPQKNDGRSVPVSMFWGSIFIFPSWAIEQRRSKLSYWL